MKRLLAIRCILSALKGSLFVCATGMISREAYSADDREENFYMIGSMGLNSAIGLGLAIHLPHREVVVLDGDGSVLMNMGMLATVGQAAPGNFVHIVLDNRSYASTGGQPSISGEVALEEVARAAGYAHATRIRDQIQLAQELDALDKRPRPAFHLVEVEPGNESGISRVCHPPPEITRRFMRATGSED